MIVTDGSFNNAFIRRELDTKYPSVMKKSYPIDVVFKAKTKFDVQNPVVGSLIAQVQENKKKEREYLKQLSKAPSIMDINISKRQRELKDFNDGGGVNDNNDDDDDDDEDGPGVPPTRQPPSLRTPAELFPTPPYTPPDGDGDNLSSTQRFLLQRSQTRGERVAEAIGQELTRTTPQPVTFSNNITRVSLKREE